MFRSPPGYFLKIVMQGLLILLLPLMFRNSLIHTLVPTHTKNWLMFNQRHVGVDWRTPATSSISKILLPAKMNNKDLSLTKQRINGLVTPCQKTTGIMYG